MCLETVWKEKRLQEFKEFVQHKLRLSRIVLSAYKYVEVMGDGEIRALYKNATFNRKSANIVVKNPTIRTIGCLLSDDSYPAGFHSWISGQKAVKSQEEMGVYHAVMMNVFVPLDSICAIGEQWGVPALVSKKIYFHPYTNFWCRTEDMVKAFVEAEKDNRRKKKSAPSRLIGKGAVSQRR